MTQQNGDQRRYDLAGDGWHIQHIVCQRLKFAPMGNTPDLGRQALSLCAPPFLSGCQPPRGRRMQHQQQEIHQFCSFETFFY